MQNIVRSYPCRFSLALTLTVGFILACGAGSPTEPEAPEPQIVYNDGIAKFRRPVPEIWVCRQNSTLIVERQSGQRHLDEAYQEVKRGFIPPADSRTPYPAWMAKEFDRLDAKHRSASARYQRAAIIASGLTPDAFEYCAGYNDQYPGAPPMPDGILRIDCGQRPPEPFSLPIGRDQGLSGNQRIPQGTYWVSMNQTKILLGHLHGRLPNSSFRNRLAGMERDTVRRRVEHAKPGTCPLHIG